ncbi:MAG: OmpA family protein [Alphaproteobacteria bacterium]|nr:OmpA family protein [Alphaproteobacteria bacterium]
MFLLALAASAAFAQSTPSAFSQDWSAITFQPTTDGSMTLWVDDAAFAARVKPSARLLLNYANDPVIWVPDDGGEQERIVSDLLTGHALLALGWDRLHLGVDVPVFLLADGTRNFETPAVGDVVGEVRVGILDPLTEPLGLAIQGRGYFPTTPLSWPLAQDGVGWEIGGIVDVRLDQTLVALNLGTRGRPGVILSNIEMNDAFYARLALAQALDPEERAGLSLEAGTELNYASDFSDDSGAPTEALVGGWLRFDDFVMRAGGGIGLTGGIGAPDARGLLSLGYEPPNVADRDGDGIVDDIDRCPDKAEDRDGFRDTDGCPDDAAMTTVRFVDEDGEPVPDVRMAIDQESGFRELNPAKANPVHPGTWGLQATSPGFVPLETTIEVPEADRHEITKVMVRPHGTLEVRVVGTDGNPIDARLVIDGGDRGRTEGEKSRLKIGAGEHTVRAMANGYRTSEVTVLLASGTVEVVEVVLEPARVVVTTERIELKEKVFFDYNKATIKPESFPLLEDVASALRDHPDIRKVRVEGHTDERGADAYNMELSDARAKAVMQFLIDKGVEPERLHAIGFGETRPLVEESNEAAWEKNRRVELHIEERSGN